MKARALFAAPSIGSITASSGDLQILRSADPLDNHLDTIVHSFVDGCRNHPDRALLQVPVGLSWRCYTWFEIGRMVDEVAQRLLDEGVAGSVIMLSGPSLSHLVLSLAAQSVGLPVVPISPAYSLKASSPHRLQAMVSMVQPEVVFAESAEFLPAVRALAARINLSADTVDGMTALSAFTTPATIAVDEARQRVHGGTVAKIMFTSGSTGMPKGVVNTHSMLAANQQQLRQIWPFIAHEPPVLLDWLPWSHTFGGNHNLNLVLTNGGTYWLDDGTPDRIDRTVANLNMARPNVYFNVPLGYSRLIERLEREPSAARVFFSSARMACCAAAAMEQSVWHRLLTLVKSFDSPTVLTSSWGLTETSPACTSAHFESDNPRNIGVPLPGVEVALRKSGDGIGKAELWVRGPNVATRYLTIDGERSAVDDQGWLRTGDAATLVEAGNPSGGLSFDGRLAEDFKLSSGTFVNAAVVRSRLLEAGAGVIRHVVLCGQDTDSVSAIIWLEPDCPPSDVIRSKLSGILATVAIGAGSSQRVARVVVATTPPDLGSGEITDKGYVNGARVRAQRQELVELVLRGEAPQVIHAPWAVGPGDG
ncbi:AMP-binding protein [Nocardia sp. NPDC051756]|uniref:AMP-binding protein n=1 Tax=Nocardia sp. NPDC051756 TaxID=3154751 RepID=UPI003445998B